MSGSYKSRVALWNLQISSLERCFVIMAAPLIVKYNFSDVRIGSSLASGVLSKLFFLCRSFGDTEYVIGYTRKSSVMLHRAIFGNLSQDL